MWVARSIAQTELEFSREIHQIRIKHGKKHLMPIFMIELLRQNHDDYSNLTFILFEILYFIKSNVYREVHIFLH